MPRRAEASPGTPPQPPPPPPLGGQRRESGCQERLRRTRAGGVTAGGGGPSRDTEVGAQAGGSPGPTATRARTGRDSRPSPSSVGRSAGTFSLWSSTVSAAILSPPQPVAVPAPVDRPSPNQRRPSSTGDFKPLPNTASHDWPGLPRHSPSTIGLSALEGRGDAERRDERPMRGGE